MINIAVNNQQDLVEVDDKLINFLKGIVNCIADLEGVKTGEVSFALVDNTIIRELNKKYRDKDLPTDVLSFPLDEEIWGDIVISTDKVREQAAEFGHSQEREMGYLAVHGVLHLLGYDHLTPEDKKIMREREEKVLNQINLIP